MEPSQEPVLHLPGLHAQLCAPALNPWDMGAIEKGKAWTQSTINHFNGC